MTLLFVTVGSAWACTYFDDFKNNGDGTITDPRSGLIWQRCSVGQVWDGSGCKKNAKRMKWEQAMLSSKSNRLNGKADWRLPTKAELETVVGDYQSCQNASRAASSLFPNVNPDDEYKFPGNMWSTSPVSDSPGYSWGVSFFTGYRDKGSHERHEQHVELVRSGESEGLREFNLEFGKIAQYASELRALKKSAARDAPTPAITYREGDNVCVMQWQGTGFCGNVDRVSGDRLKVQITNITCGGWVGQCSADPCSGGVKVGTEQAKVKDFVWTEKYCVTSR